MSNHVGSYLPKHQPNGLPLNLSARYVPALSLCIIASILFFCATAVHSYRTIRHRCWFFLPVVLAGIMETVGYIFRALSSQKDPYSIIYFVIQYFFIVVAPVFLSASIYVCLSKLIRAASMQGGDAGSKLKRFLRPKGILWVFITSDVVCTIMQIAGAALIGVKESNSESPTTANNILLAGLAVQSFTFLIFLLLLITFKQSLNRDQRFGWRWNQPFFAIVGIASLLVFIRTLFRLAETSQGVFGFLSTHEVFFGCLEFMPVVVAVSLLAIWHPGRWLNQTSKANRVRNEEDALPADTAEK